MNKIWLWPWHGADHTAELLLSLSECYITVLYHPLMKTLPHQYWAYPQSWVPSHQQPHNNRTRFPSTGSCICHFIAICEFKLFIELFIVKFDIWTRKMTGSPFVAILRVVHNFSAICEFKPGLQYRDPRFGSKLKIFCPVTPWHLADYTGKRRGTPSMSLQALSITSRPSMNPNLCFFTVVTLTFAILHGHHFLSVVITSENFMMIRWEEHCETLWWTGRWLASRTRPFIEQLLRC